MHAVTNPGGTTRWIQSSTSKCLRIAPPTFASAPRNWKHAGIARRPNELVRCGALISQRGDGEDSELQVGSAHRLVCDAGGIRCSVERHALSIDARRLSERRTYGLRVCLRAGRDAEEQAADDPRRRRHARPHQLTECGGHAAADFPKGGPAPPPPPARGAPAPPPRGACRRALERRHGPRTP